MKPIFIHVHIFYFDLWPELKACIKNFAKYPYELFVTMVDDNPVLKEDILKTFTNAKIKIVENKGYDIAPFIYTLSQIDIDKYSYIVKLHTKRNMPENSTLQDFDLSGNKWRKYLLHPFSSKDNVNKCLECFSKNPKLGMIGDYHLIMKDECDQKARNTAQQYVEQLGFNVKNFGFIAGTMFICRAELLKPLQKLNFKFESFETADATHRSSTLAHALERLFGILILAEGFEILDVFNSNPIKIILLSLVTKAECRLKHFLYKKKITKDGKLIVKICKIPVIYKKIRTNT
jgi:lipopolysaccharide biosynthesis protein